MAYLIGGVYKVGSFTKEGMYTRCNNNSLDFPLFASRAWINTIPWAFCDRKGLACEGGLHYQMGVFKSDQLRV